jgi:hypothetical protein
MGAKRLLVLQLGRLGTSHAFVCGCITEIVRPTPVRSCTAFCCLGFVVWGGGLIATGQDCGALMGDHSLQLAGLSKQLVQLGACFCYYMSHLQRLKI